MLNRQFDRGAQAPLCNSILAALPKATFDKLAPHLTFMDLPQGTVLVEAHKNSRWLYFLERGMGSISSSDFSGTPVEVGIVGREGIVGLHLLLGQKQTQNVTLMQVAGDGYRISADILTPELVLEDQDLARVIHTFIYALYEQTTQLVLCNRLHELEARLARWLLMTSDIVESRTLHLTQEFLAEMLGVGRPSVTISAGILQRAGAISYSRGQVELVNVPMLQESACECYRVIREAYKRAYPDTISVNR